MTEYERKRLWETSPKGKATKHRWYLKNKKSVMIRAMAWSKANPEKVRISKANWQHANPERGRAACARWRPKNLHKKTAQEGKRRARKKSSLVYLSREEVEKINEIYRQCRLMSDLTGVQYHVDHKISLSRGGLHHPDNLQLLTATENLKKGAK